MEAWIELAAQRRPDAVAVDAPDGALTYAELLERSRECEPPEVLEGPPSAAFAVALHARLLRGLPAVVGGSVEAPAGTVLVVHTSGTTGEPKPVFISRANVEANAAGSAAALGLDPDERWLSPMPLTHVGGLMVLLRSAIYATTAVLVPWDVERVLERFADATVASLVPTMLLRALDAGLARPPRLRWVLLGGGPADDALLERAAQAGVPVATTYGLTEATSQVTVNGRPLPGVHVELAADGEILVSGPTVAGGGVLRTGDLGELGPDGRLSVVGRKADTIVTGGENVAPAEVEAVLRAHPRVRDAAVVGRPDPEWGEAVVALVVSDAGGHELRAWCRERLAPFKVPKAFEPVGSLPRTVSGKLLRRELR